MRERAGGGAFNGVGQAGGAAFRNYDAVGAGGERGANNGAEIVRIFDAVEKNEEALRSFGCEQVFEFDRGFRGAECGHALMFARAGEAIELDAIFESYGDAFRVGELDDGFHAVAVAAAAITMRSSARPAARASSTAWNPVNQFMVGETFVVSSF